MSSILPYNALYPIIHPSVYIAEGARIIGNVCLEENASVWFNAVVRGDINSIHIGKGTNIQDLSVIHVTQNNFPVVVGNYTTIGHRAVIHGCTIGDYTLIGMGSVLLDGVRVGTNVIIAAGSVVLEHTEIPNGVLVAGVPAKIKRTLTEEERTNIRQSAYHYIDYARKYVEEKERVRL